MTANKFVVFFYTGEWGVVYTNSELAPGCAWDNINLPSSSEETLHPMWSPWSSADRRTQQAVTQVPRLGLRTLPKLDVNEANACQKVSEVGIL
jgi:hypothetical protein